MDVVLLDEAHTVSLPNVVHVPAYSEVEIPSQYPTLLDIQQKWFELNGKQLEKINQIANEGRKGNVGKHLSKIFPNENPLNFRQLVAACNDLYDLALHRKEFGVQDKDILLLRDMTRLLSSYWLNITYVTEKVGKDGTVYIAGNYWTGMSALKTFLTDHAHHADHLYISGTLIEPYPDFFSELSGKKVNDVVFPDINDTNEKLVIYPDTWRLSARNFKGNLPRILDRIVGICKENPVEDVFIVAPNARMATTIQSCLVKNMGDAAPLVDYYRSDETMGVENSARICIAIGLAELPSNVYDHLAQGSNEDEKWIDSQRLRQESVDAATWRTVSRVKDPEGKDESCVYFVGVREDRIRSVLNWGPGRRLELERIKPYKLPDGTSGRAAKFRTSVREPIKPPKIASKTVAATAGRARGSLSSWVEAAEKYDPTLIISDFGTNLSIINNRQNTNKLGIYNNPRDEFEVAATSAVLTSLFASRDDHYALQNKSPDESGRYGYIKHPGKRPSILRLMEEHVKRKLTMGFYQISLDDTVKRVCFDIDDHKGDRGAEAVNQDVRKLASVLDKHGIPFFLEASGSQNSYHVWILLKPTKTNNAFRFSRLIRAESGIECEVYPKQKSLNKDSKFGNLVKVPVCLNWRSRAKSQFLDPATFEPYSAMVPIPAIVSLNDMSEPQEIAQKKRKTVRPRRENREKEESTRTPKLVGRGLRLCMRGALEAKVALEGSEGHEMRVAIATEAWNTGLTEGECIELFSVQPDFDKEVTRAKVKEIYARSYNPWNCDTLRDKCGSFVSPYCSDCLSS
ncbi:MAG: hypothetical protein ABR985_18070 [Methanotrichaceae archaeon]